MQTNVFKPTYGLAPLSRGIFCYDSLLNVVGKMDAHGFPINGIVRGLIQ